MSEAERPAREWRFYIDDVIRFAGKVLSYTEGMDRAAFIASIEETQTGFKSRIREVHSMKNITFSADEKLIEAARGRARAEHSTLNEQFRLWLADHARSIGKRTRRWPWSRSCAGKSVPVAASSPAMR